MPNHRYEEFSISETRRQILKESRERHGGQRLRSEITIPITGARPEKNVLSRNEETRVNSTSGGIHKNKIEVQNKLNSQTNGKHLVSKEPKTKETVAAKES